MKRRFITSTVAIITLFSPFSYPVLLADNSPSISTGSVAMTKPIKWFLNIRTPEANITKTNGILTLHLNNPTILAVPMAKEASKNVSIQEFTRGWSKGSNSYKADNPNAALNYYANNKMFGNPIVLSNPVVSGTTLSLNVRTYPASDESKIIINTPLRGVSLQLDPTGSEFFDSTSSK